MLLIDSGNSAIKCRYITAKKVDDQTFSTYKDASLTCFSDYLSTIKPAQVYIASVSSEQLTREIKYAVEKKTGITAAQLTSLAELGGLKNGYVNHQQLGVDRWLALLSVYEQLTADAIVIDAGSAITIDLLSKNKGHLGGAILPGLNTHRERFKKMFPSIDFAHPDIDHVETPGRTTLSCIHITQAPATTVQVYQLINRWELFLEKPLNIWLCGQDAEKIALNLKGGCKISSDLVFKGMLKQIQLLG